MSTEIPAATTAAQFHLFMSGLDPNIPDMAEGRRSNFIDLPNAEFSRPLVGQETVTRYLDTLEIGEHLGFDGLVVMEQRAPGSYPSAMMLTTWLAARTHGIRIGAVGPVVNTYLNPLRLAEEIALLDAMSGGRFFVGFPLGIGPAYHHMGVNPSLARRRYAEGVALVKRALTEPGPFEHRGEFYNLPIVNVYPRPAGLPPIWIPAAGSQESLELAARGRHTYMAVQNPRQNLIRNTMRFRDAARASGYEPTRDQVAAVVNVHVAESDAQARKEAEAHLLAFNQNLMRSAFGDFFPPGYTSVASLEAMLAHGYRSVGPEHLTLEDMRREGMAIVGSPETVRTELEQLIEELGAGHVIVMGDCGTMPEWMTRKNVGLFASEVLPYFRPGDPRPVWERERPRGYTTVAEKAARIAPPPRRAVANVPGEGRIDVLTSHVDDLRVPID